MAKKKAFQPPTDVKQFWVAPHCGPGTLDINETCGFCGDSHQECAQKFSDFLRNASEVLLLAYSKTMFGDHRDIEKMGIECPCGGSGFWCSKCGHFWAQDSCGDSGGTSHQSCDGDSLDFDDNNNVLCVCGNRVMIEKDENNEDEDDEDDNNLDFAT
jgi:hypothetical protein